MVKGGGRLGKSIFKMVDEQYDTINLLKQTMAHNIVWALLRIEIKELDSHDATHEVKLLGNFSWHIEKQLGKMGGSFDEVKVNVVAMFLKGTTKL